MRKAVGLILLAALSCMLAGCGPATPAPTPEPSEAVTKVPEDIIATPVPEMSASPTPAPEPPVSPGPTGELPWPVPVDTGETKTFTLALEGVDEQVEMTRLALDLGLFGGPVVSLYVDTGRYSCFAFEGDYTIAPAGEDPDNGAHIAWLAGQTADICAEEALTGGANTQDGGMVELGSWEAYCVLIDDGSAWQTRYYIPVGEDTLALTVYGTAETAEGHAVRLTASLKTLEIPDAPQ